MKQTAVQWYAERLYDLEMAYNQGVIKTNTYIKGKREAVEQAKEMEKEQIIDAVDEGISQGYGKYIDTEWGRENDWKAEQYYNETYGGNK